MSTPERQTKENPPDSPASSGDFHENFIARFHSLYEQARTDQGGESLNGMRDMLHGPQARVFHDYQAGKFLSMETFKSSIDLIINALRAEIDLSDDKEEQTILQGHMKYFSGRVNYIQGAACSYADSVARFHNIRLQQVRLNEEDFRYQLMRIDRERRRQHEALITALQEYDARIQSLRKDGYLEGVQCKEWNKSLVSAQDSSTVYLFPKQFLSDREMIREWAIAVDLDTNLKIAEEFVTRTAGNN